MFKIYLSKHIYRNCSTYELGYWAEKCIKIPLPPFIGLIIDIGCGERKDIKIIKYDCDTKEIRCFVGTDYHEDYEHIKNIDKNHAKWIIRETPKGVYQENLTDLF